jgi:acyl-coenzyme A synthetase/AMP-(fatty) acid ligase
VVATDLPNVAEGIMLHLACARLGAALAMAKNADMLNNSIPAVIRCVVTPEQDSWLSNQSLAAPPILAGGDEMNSMLNRVHEDDSSLDTDDDEQASERAVGYFNSSKPLTHGSALLLGQDMKRHFNMTQDDRVCVSIMLYHAFGIGSACSSALLSGAAIVLPAVGGLRGCGVPSQRAQVTLNTLVSEKCTLLFTDTHTLKALHDDSESLNTAELTTLRGGICKTGSGSDILEETVDLASVALSKLGKKL